MSGGKRRTRRGRWANEAAAGPRRELEIDPFPSSSKQDFGNHNSPLPRPTNSALCSSALFCPRRRPDSGLTHSLQHGANFNGLVPCRDCPQSGPIQGGYPYFP